MKKPTHLTRLKNIAYDVGVTLNNKLLGHMHRNGLMLYAVSATVDAAGHAALPEAQRGWYTKDGEEFKLDLTKVEIEDAAGLKTALEKTRLEVKEAKSAAKTALAEALKAYEGIDPVKTRALLSKFDNEEEAAMIAAGKIDEVLTKRTAKRDAELQKQVDAATAATKAAQTVADTFKGRVLDNHIRAAASKAGLHPFAVDDALLRARSIFTLDDKGDAVQLDTTGSAVLGKDGKTAFAPAEWLESMKETAPHWFPSGASGGGAGGSGSASAGAKTVTRAAFDSMTPQERATAVRTHTITD